MNSTLQNRIWLEGPEPFLRHDRSDQVPQSYHHVRIFSFLVNVPAKRAFMSSNKCLCVFLTSEPHLFGEHITRHLFVLQGRAYLYVLPVLYLWPSYKRPLSIFFLFSSIDLLASRHFWTLKVAKKEEIMLGYIHFFCRMLGA